MAMEQANSKYCNFEHVFKITTKDKDFLEQIVEYLRLAYDCEVTSPMMYSEKTDRFFQYVAVDKESLSLVHYYIIGKIVSAKENGAVNIYISEPNKSPTIFAGFAHKGRLELLL